MSYTSSVKRNESNLLSKLSFTQILSSKGCLLRNSSLTPNGDLRGFMKRSFKSKRIRSVLAKKPEISYIKKRSARRNGKSEKRKGSSRILT